MQLGCLWALLGAALQASAQNITWMCIGRVINGVGCGHLNTVVPMWTSELADASMRGAFVAVQFTLALVGSTLCVRKPPKSIQILMKHRAYWMEYGCVKHMEPVAAWRFPIAFQCIFLFAIIFAAPFFPESPRHLAKLGRFDEARDILARCRVDPDPSKVDIEMREIQHALRIEAQSSHTYYSMLFVSDNLHTRRRIFLGAGVQVMQKLTGIDFIATYAPQMFALAGYTGDKPALLAGGNFFGYTASLAVAIYLSDRFGRRKLMFTGSLLMGIVLIVGGVLAHAVLANTKTNPSKANSLGGGVAAILYIYTFIYGSCWLTTCWVYPTEVFPTSSRAKGTALATVAFSLAGGTINEIVPYLITAVGFWVFILFAFLNFIMLVPIYLFYIGKSIQNLGINPSSNQWTETANRKLEDFDLLFSTKSVLFWRAEAEFAEKKATQTIEKT
jgi:MFS family permease